MAARDWGFWTEHKLDVLGDYLTAFTRASKAAGKTVYLDLFAGQVENVSRTTGEVIEGSPIRALKTDPALSVVALFEMPARAAAIKMRLTRDFPGRDLRVYAGDCNETIDQALKDLGGLSWAPTFTFIDQESTEIRWTTLEKLAHHKAGKKWKVELWMLFADPQLPRALGVKKKIDEKFAASMDDMYGTGLWRIAYQARRDNLLSPEELRHELTNLMRWRLERDLGYKYTHSFELLNNNGGPIYSMIFATDNPTGDKIMSHIYGKAAREHGQMQQEALARLKGLKENELGNPGLFDPPVRVSTIDPEKLYKASPPTQPYGWLEDQANVS
jgi:three-Cys-motif partner protein